jgi:hypothetical protein
MGTHDIEQIEDHITRQLSVPDRKRLTDSLAGLDKVMGRLKSRQFVQVMAGSACKRPRHKDKPRSFCVHAIDRKESGYQFSSDSYAWSYQTKRFVDQPKTETIVFQIPLS